eukprot:10680911-Alexandrium_andersonii.AAC.1
MSHVWCVHVRLHVQVAVVSSLGQWSHGVKCVALGHRGSFSPRTLNQKCHRTVAPQTCTLEASTKLS